MGDRSVVSLRDWRVFEKVIPKYVTSFIDIDKAITLLHERKYITADVKQNLLSVYQIPRPDRNVLLLKELLKLTDFQDVVKFLQDIGQNEFANELILERYGSGIFIPSQGADIAVTRGTFRYYNNMKIQMDNNIYKNGRIHELLRRSNLLQTQLRTEQNPLSRQRLVNRFAVVTYQKVAQYRDRHKRVQILNEMKDSLPADVDPNFTNIIYACKMAVTEMHTGDMDTAASYMNEAFRQCDGCNQTFVKAFLFHDSQFVSRIQHSYSPADKHLKDIISRGDLGLLFMQEELDSSAQIWSRIYLTENAMGLLKIRSNFRVHVDENVDRSDIEHAEQLLAHLARAHDSLELRREMMSYLCQARVCELKGNIKDAIRFACKANVLANEGVHFPNDATNIYDYYKYLCRKGQGQEQN